MDKNWQGLDFLRGLGIFGLLIMHSAFYYFDGLWDLDLDNPPLIITIIGFLLMFAGLFAILSGTVHGLSMLRLSRRGWSPARIFRKKAVSGLFILVVAYLYFIFTGPGLAEFANRRMNNSILVELIQSGQLAGTNLDRVLYVDSLVMIGCNILLVSLVWLVLLRTRQLKAGVLLGISFLVMVVSLSRLWLYPIYLEQLDQKNWPAVLALFWLVNKNNPVLPYLAFGLLGSWLGIRLEDGKPRQPVIWLGLALLLTGLGLYLFLPDTMLQRSIDLKWYSIMVMQLGLFLLMILAALAVLDRDPAVAAVRTGWSKPAGLVVRFITRFGHAGLTAFFLESIVAALAWRLLNLPVPGIQLGIGSALLFGLILALIWGFGLLFWERRQYVGSIEFLYGQIVTRFGQFSSKADTLKEKRG